MNPNCRRFLLPAYGAEVKQAERAIALAKEEALKISSVKKVALYLFEKINLKEGRTIRNAIGDKPSKDLLKNREVPFSNEAFMYLATYRTISKRPQPDLVLVAYATMKMLWRAEALQNVKSMIVLTWETGRIADWIKRHQPEIHGRPSLVMIEGLRTLMDRIVPESGWTSENREAATELFHILKSSGHWCHPPLMGEWVELSGWPYRLAQELKSIAMSVENSVAAMRFEPRWWRGDIAQVLAERSERNHDLYM